MTIESMEPTLFYLRASESIINDNGKVEARNFIILRIYLDHLRQFSVE